jgi:chromate reductase
MTDSRQFKVLGVSGSLRKDSYNTKLLRAAAEVAPEGMTVEIADISDIPMYNADTETAEGFPKPVERFRAQLEDADGVLFATPEYNYSVTGVMKNAIDWASRRPSPLDFKPAAIFGAGGGSGTARAQQHLRDILKHNDLRVIAEPEVLVARARRFFNDGQLTDTAVRAEIRSLLEALLETLEQAEAA